MKRLLVVFLMLLLIMGVVFAQTLRDGTYTATADGYIGPITVRVTISGNRLSGIELTDHIDTPEFVFMVRNALIPRIIGAQSADVDGVTGATSTAEGIKQAVRTALIQARS